MEDTEITNCYSKRVIVNSHLNSASGQIAASLLSPPITHPLLFPTQNPHIITPPHPFTAAPSPTTATVFDKE